MDLFTVKCELGSETCRLIERVASEALTTADRVAGNAIIRIELGEKTRATRPFFTVHDA